MSRVDQAAVTIALTIALLPVAVAVVVLFLPFLAMLLIGTVITGNPNWLKELT